MNDKENTLVNTQVTTQMHIDLTRPSADHNIWVVDDEPINFDVQSEFCLDYIGYHTNCQQYLTWQTNLLQL